MEERLNIRVYIIRQRRRRTHGNLPVAVVCVCVCGGEDYIISTDRFNYKQKLNAARLINGRIRLRNAYGKYFQRGR